MKKVHHGKATRSHYSQSALSWNNFFSGGTDGKLRLAAVAFIAVGLSYLLWQAGMLSGLP